MMEGLWVGPVDLSAIMRSGVYVLRSRGRTVFVGQAKSVLAKVYAHRSARKRPLPLGLAPAVVFDEVRVWPCRIDQLDEVLALVYVAESWSPA